MLEGRNLGDERGNVANSHGHSVARAARAGTLGEECARDALLLSASMRPDGAASDARLDMPSFHLLQGKAIMLINFVNNN
jgi:hypothetical protein